MHMYRNKRFIEDVMRLLDCEAEISWEAERDCFTFDQKLEIDGTSYSLFIEVRGSDPLVSVFLYNPSRLPDERYAEARELADMINMKQVCGRMNVAGNFMRYIQTIDLENCALDPNLVLNMINSAVGAFSPSVSSVIRDLTLTRLSLDEILAKQEPA